ncbi:chemotaxis protein CheW [Thalassobaculum sp.]|uniref:chemotaxis protein CheW n=1 Tax=Thalassobaculum sp. TaxID=2022740 RepID=UPI003B5CF843
MNAVVGSGKPGGNQERIPVLLFMSDGRRFGVPLARVREVVEIERMEPIEGESDHYIGVMVLRDEPIPLVVMRLHPREEDLDLAMCIVMQRGSAVIGLAVEKILGIRDFGPAKPMHGLVAGNEVQHAFLDEKGELVQAVDADRWFNAQSTLPLLADQRAVAERTDPDELRVRQRPKYMAITVGGQLFAIDSGVVERAIDDIGTAPLPRRPGVKIDSVIEVSGNILPVLRLTEDGFEKQSIHIIVSHFDQKWAIATEGVLGIVDDESPPGPADEEGQARVITHKGTFHEVVDLTGLIAAHVPEFNRGGDRSVALT